MKGNNSLRLCPAAMNEIMNDWLKENLPGNHEVTCVAGNSTVGGGFTVEFKEIEAIPDCDDITLATRKAC